MGSRLRGNDGDDFWQAYTNAVFNRKEIRTNIFYFLFRDSYSIVPTWINCSITQHMVNCRHDELKTDRQTVLAAVIEIGTGTDHA